MRLSSKTGIIALLVLMVALLVQCSSSSNDGDDKDKSEVKVPDFSAGDASKGQALAAQYCQTCHQLPEPVLLNKSIWQYNVLPLMGQYLGIPTPPSYHTPQIDKKYVPAKPIISAAEWKQIYAYYVRNAPARMPALNREEPIHELPSFNIIPAPAEWVSTQAFTSYVKIDTSVSPRRLIVGDGLNNRLIVLNDKGKTLNSAIFNSAVVNLLFQKNSITATTIGTNLEANDLKDGSITDINIAANGAITPKGASLFTGLSRPLSVDMVDLNEDGKQDYLITQFGKNTGGLSWYEGLGANKKEHVLRDKPGAVKAIIDYNNNKRPDIWALFAQGDEGIFLYTNKGKGVFEEKRVLTFPPSYGSVSFELVDFNGDGFKDIIYACGDNADYSQILKPYHGVYIYLNDGKNNFSKKYFYPIHGCNKAIARDFDGDGDLDIATISEYPGVKIPWEGFIYLENKGNFNFQGYTLPLKTPFTRGMTMDAGDIDGDGKLDLLLGAGFVAEDVNGTDKKPLFLVLKNSGK